MLLKYEHAGKLNSFYETNGYYVDSNFFRVFTYDFVYGNASSALKEPNSLVISNEIARRLFGNENPIDKVVVVGLPYGNFNYRVCGVFNDLHLKSHIPVHFFLSMRNNDVGTWVVNQTNWATNNIFYTYVKLKPGSDPAVFEKKLQPFIDGRAGRDLKAMGIIRQLFIQPIQDIYLYSDLDNEIATNGNITHLYVLGSIAFFVLIIACINFMNLSTARSMKRAKEVGIRKVLGAEKRLLVRQFLGESVIMSCLALLLAIIIASLLQPLFNSYTQKNEPLFQQRALWLCIAILTFGTGVFSGLYPAFYLSSFKPISLLNGKLLNNLSGSMIRKGLVAFQFVISICLILSVVVIEQQLRFMDNRQLGFNKDQQIILPLQSQDVIKSYQVLKTQLLKNPGIKSVTAGSTYPGIANIEDMLFYAEGKSVNDVVALALANIDNDYFETLGLKLLAGRGFSRDFTADSGSIILNEVAVKAMGYDIHSAVGKNIYFDFQGTHQTMRIVGIVRNFNFEGLYNAIKPFAFNKVLGKRYSYLIANLRTNDYKTILKETEKS